LKLELADLQSQGQTKYDRRIYKGDLFKRHLPIYSPTNSPPHLGVFSRVRKLSQEQAPPGKFILFVQTWKVQEGKRKTQILKERSE
jgi:hypothetical protein